MSKAITEKKYYRVGETFSYTDKDYNGLLDCFCIGAFGSIIGVSSFLFPVFISIFQLVFLSIGNMLGKKLHRLSNLPDNIWSVISGILLVLIGVVRFVV